MDDVDGCSDGCSEGWRQAVQRERYGGGFQRLVAVRGCSERCREGLQRGVAAMSCSDGLP